MAEITWTLTTLDIDTLTDYAKNPRSLTDAQFKQLKTSLDKFGMIDKPIINLDTANTVIGGHQRLRVLRHEGVKACECWTPNRELTGREVEELNIRLNANTGNWDVDTLANQWEMSDLKEWGLELPGFDFDVEGGAGGEQEAHKTLAERFGVPPFSVLDARQGYWQERKRAWIALGIESELGRGDCITCPGDAITEAGLNYYRNRKGTLGAIAPNEGGENGILARTGKYAVNGLLGNSQQARSHYAGKEIATSFSSQSRLNALQKTGDSRAVDYGTAGNISEQSGTSIFDPVLCELAYRWFMPKTGVILDPFAGGSVRGIVASLIGKQYTGIDLRPEQVEANEQQAAQICPDALPRWIVGDSQNVKELAAGKYDFIFSCPPYFDLELYSDNPADLSNSGDYDAFIKVYRAIIAACVDMLKPDRFACFVVGDIRDKRGFYRNFPADTIQAFEDAGATLYNEAILVTAVGSLPIRTSRMFQSGRKLGKTHQNVLVFYKGDPKRIKEFGDVECGDVADLTGKTPELVEKV
jgi:DNA modification methylase